MKKKWMSIIMLVVFLIGQPFDVLAQNSQIEKIDYLPASGNGFSHYPMVKNSELNNVYLMRGPQGALWVTKDTIWLTAFEDPTVSYQSRSVNEKINHGVNIKISFPHANPLVKLNPEQLMPGAISYIKGQNPEDWLTDLSLWGSLRFSELYPGVDLILTSTETGFVWNYEIRSEFDLSELRLLVEGASGIDQVDSVYVLQTDIGDLSIPILGLENYDRDNLELNKTPKLISNDLIEIYPQTSISELQNETSDTLFYSTLLGGTGRDEATEVVVDTSGNVYMTGTTFSSDFPITAGAFVDNNDLQDGFITKIEMNGISPTLVYSTYIGGSGTERANSLDVKNGIAYVTGETDSPDFPISGSSSQVDIFAVALNSIGNGLNYSRLIGGSDDDYGYGIQVENGQAYLTGITYSSDFPITSGSTYQGSGDVFVVKLGSDGNTSYAILKGTRTIEAGFDIVVQSGISWVTGEATLRDFGSPYMGGSDVFLIQVGTSGSIISTRLFGGTGDDVGISLTIDDGGDLYITGSTNSVNFPVNNGSTYGGGLYDAFLLKLSSTATIYSTYLGGSASDQGSGIALDVNGGIVVTGYTFSNDFPVTSDAFQSDYGGNGDAFVTRYFLAGEDFEKRSYSSYLGGTGNDDSRSVAIDNTVYAHIIGLTKSTDFPITTNALYQTLNGTQDAFLSILPVGPLPMISIQKTTNGEDANEAPGPYVYPGTPITWEYLVTNQGEVTLNEINVTDNQGVIVTCPQTSLIAGTSMTCTASGTAVADQYSNMGTVTARTPYDTIIGDTDASHYFGAVPDTTLVKKTNDVVVSQPSDLYIEETGNITWTYEVTNSGNVDLTGVSVVDDNGTPDNTGDDIAVCTIPTLVAGATDTTTCALTGNAVPGPYSNLAVVVGTPPGGLDDVSDQDASYYFGSAPGISLVKKLDGVVTTSPGPFLLKDEAITWTYEVTNTGNVDLTNVTVVDDNGTADIEDDITICSGLTITAGNSDLSNCSLPDTVSTGSYHNIATVTGTPPVGSDVTATADGYYFGSDPVVEIAYSVNTDAADSSPGLYVLTGSELNLAYVVTNAGNVDLTGILVTDGVGNSISCPKTTLSPEEPMTCTATMTASSGQQSVLATVTATPPSSLENIEANDLIYYFGSSPSISIDKQTNGEQGDQEPGVYVITGSTVNWSYLVKNTGNVILTGVTVVDDNGTPTNSADDRIPTGCNNITLTPSQEVTCTLSGTAVVGQYTNIADATGNPPTPLNPVNASDTSHYFGSTLSVSLNKQTNSQDAASAPGPLIAEGDPVNWTYSITNSSNVAVGFTIVDNPAVSITCDKNTLAVGENIVCTASGTAVAGQYTNTATVTVNPPGELASFDVSDTSHYFGVITGLQIKKSTNGQDANTAPGPFIKVGDPVEWTYEVTNTGNVDLINVSVTDDQGVSVSCPQTSLAPSASMTCDATGTAVAGQYTNTGTVTADPPTGFTQMSDTDISHYYGSDASIDIQKFTNGDDNTAEPGIYILVGNTVTWTYRIENTGNVDLENVLVRDDKGTEILTDDYNCTIPSLAIGAIDTSTCSTNELAEAGQYSNTAYVSADIVNLDGQVFDQDSSWYFGADPGIQIVKIINGQDVSEPPGPYIPVGETVNYSYVISYVGDPYQLTSIEITDESGVIPTCPIDQLSGGEILTCEGQGIAGTGQQSDVVYVSATTWLDADEPLELGVVTSSDISHYFGYTLGIDLKKYTNGTDVSDAPGVELPIDSQVTWTYEVTNTSNVEISEVAVNDVPEGVINCPKDSLASSETIVCSKTGIVQEGDYQNEATASAIFVPNAEVTEHLSDTDRSYYRGIPAFKVFIPLLMR